MMSLLNLKILPNHNGMSQVLIQVFERKASLTLIATAKYKYQLKN